MEYIKDSLLLRNKLKEIRLSLGLKQEEVAKKLGMNCADRLSHWEKGKAMPNLINLFKLSILYRTDPEKLYEELWLYLLTNKINEESSSLKNYQN